MASVSYCPANAVKKGGFVLLKGKPCKVLEVNWSKTGKHGSGKILFVGMDLLTGKKVTDHTPATHTVEIPDVIRTEHQIMSVDEHGETVTILSEDGERDLPLPKGNLGEELVEAYAKSGDDENKVLIAAVVNVLDKEAVSGYKWGKAI